MRLVEDPSLLLIVSENRLFAQAAGNLLVDRSSISAFLHLRPEQVLDTAGQLDAEPEVALIDPDGFLEPEAAVAAVENIRQRFADAKLLVLGYAAQQELLCLCIESGANGCLLKTETFTDFVAAVESVRRGQTYCCGQVADAVLQRIRKLSAAKADSAPTTRIELTPRELEILQLVDQGMLNKEISRQLGLALSTVKNHLHSIFEKLAVNSRKTAVRQAIAAGLLSCQPGREVA